MPPSTDTEQCFWSQGFTRIAGVDEAGRGCWAGPVVAAAVVLPAEVLKQPERLQGVDDSKKLSAGQRLVAYDTIRILAESVGVGVVPAFVIDTIGILPATHLAMMVALLGLSCSVDALAIDALLLPGLQLPQQALIKGDARCLSIAAASIVAKVQRDRLMATAELAWPGYGFAAHKGYGTTIHQQALHSYGPCPLHRMSFRPIRELLV